MMILAPLFLQNNLKFSCFTSVKVKYNFILISFTLDFTQVCDQVNLWRGDWVEKHGQLYDTSYD